jgi:putative ABC transport system permease protein
VRSTAVDKDLPVGEIRTVKQVISDSVAPRRFAMALLGIFASVALILAMVGIYGMTSYFGSQQTHEIGIRMALGAQREDVLRLVVRQGMILALIGVAIGVLLALVVRRVISSFLYGVTATDPGTFAAVSLLLVGVALLACYVPALRAMKVDPIVALRCE